VCPNRFIAFLKVTSKKKTLWQSFLWSIHSLLTEDRHENYQIERSESHKNFQKTVVRKITKTYIFLLLKVNIYFKFMLGIEIFKHCNWSDKYSQFKLGLKHLQVIVVRCTKEPPPPQNAPPDALQTSHKTRHKTSYKTRDNTCRKTHRKTILKTRCKTSHETHYKTRVKTRRKTCR